MNFRTTLILIFLLAIVAGYIAWDRLRPPAPASVQSSATSLLGLPEDQVRGFSITSDSKPPVSVLLTDAKRWVVTAPIEAIADVTATESFARQVLAFQSAGEVSEAQRAAFIPATTLTLVLTKGRNGELAVAKPNAVGDSIARVTLDNRVRWSLVGSDVLPAITQGPDTFQQSRFVTVQPDDIGLVTLDTGTEWIRLTKDPDGWGLDFGPTPAPPLSANIPRGQFRADPAAVRELLAALTSARAETLLPVPPPGAFALPQLTIQYTQFGATTQPLAGIPGYRILRFGRFEDARRERVIASSDTPPIGGYVPVATLNTLLKSPLDLRDKLVLRLAAADIQSIAIEREGVPPQTLTRSGDTWKLGTTPADPDKVAKLLAELESLRATRFLPPSPVVPDTPLTLRISTASGESVLYVGKDLLRTRDLTFESPTDLFDLVQSLLSAASPPATPPAAPPATPPAAPQPPSTPPTLPP